MTDPRPILVTGATGYIGGRLVPRLLEAGYALRCLARAPGKLSDRPWTADPRVQIRQADLWARDALVEAMRGCGVAFYLVHSMRSAGGQDLIRDRELARTFTEAAEQAGLARIVYLGGLGDVGPAVSGPLAARHEVARILASGATPVTVLRAPMIIGSGSAAFEVLRYLVERLPIMLTPRWALAECQPIAVRNVLQYLVACLSTPATEGRTLDIGGPDVLTYRELMRIMAEARGLRPRLMIPLPVLTPRLSALWIHLLTPISYRVALPLVEELCHRVVCQNDEAPRLMPQRLLSVQEAIGLAFDRVEQRNVRTVWSSAGPIPGDPDWSGGTIFTDVRSVELDVPPAVVYRAVCRIGGVNGWYAADRLWRWRGTLDRLVGGPGLRRGRRDPEFLFFGEAVDFWRVTGLEQNHFLRLQAEMKVPGEAVLEFMIEPRNARGDSVAPDAADRAVRARLTQTARFRPRGLAGLVYWYMVLPFHGIVFGRMLRGIRGVAEHLAARPGAPD